MQKAARFCSRILALACVALSSAPLAAAQASQPVIVAYVFPRDAQIEPGDIAAQKVTRINYAFANIANGRIVNGYSHDDQNLAALVALKRQNPSLTVLASVGGWLWSYGFSDMALTHESRAVFIRSVADYVTQHQLDGLDIDWEFPGMPGAQPKFRVEDKQNYTLLVKELRARFNKLERKLHRKLYITVATGSGTDFLEHTEMALVARYVDTVNLMAYDYYEPGPGSMTGNHAPLYTDAADPRQASADDSVRNYIKAGVPADKIVLGVPFYGHAWGQVPDVNHGLFQPGAEIPGAYALYSDSLSVAKQAGFVRYWDAASDAPSLYNAEKQVFISYDDPESLALKCKYILDHKLRGVMFWTYESDGTGELLNAVDAGLGRSASAGSGGK